MTEYRVKVAGNVENQLRDLELVQNANPFGDNATLYIASTDGNRRTAYTEGTRIKIQSREFNSGSSWSTMLDGYVVEPRQRDEGNGGGVLEVEVYALDSLLRRGTVGADLSGQSLKDALKQVVQDYTPASWNSNNVNIVDNQQVTRSFVNEKTDNIILALRAKSGNETFGVNDNLEFYFRPAETSTVSRGIGPEHCLETDLPVRAAEQLNEVVTYFDDGKRAVIVDDSSAKKNLQDKLGASEAVSFDESIMREQVTTRVDAADAGQQELTDRKPVLSGKVETFGLLDAAPGDTIPVEIPRRGVRDEFIIAQLTYELNDRVTVTVVETPDDQQKSTDPHSDMLVRVSDTLKRVEMRPAAARGQLEEIVRALETEIGIIVKSGGSVDSVPLDTAILTNDGFQRLRDALLNENAIDISNVVVGTDDSKPSRSQSSLGSQSESVSATVSTAGSDGVDISGSPTTGDDIAEVGLKTASGDLLLRATVDKPVTGPDGADVSLSIADDDEIEDSVLNDTGKTLIRDVLANNSPDWPSDYGLGDDGSALDEATNTLGNKISTTPLGDNFIEEVEGQDAWLDIVSGETYVYIEKGKLKHAQTAFPQDAQDVGGSGNIVSGSQFTGGEAVNLTDTSGSGQAAIATNAESAVRLPAAGVAIRARDNDGSSEVTLDVNGKKKRISISNTLEWESFDTVGQIQDGVNGVTLFPTTNCDIDVDVIALYDTSQYDISSWDNGTGGSGEYLDDPKLYPSSTDVRLGGDGIDLDRQTDELEVVSSWNDTSNNQAIVVEGNVAKNTESTTQTFATTSTLNVDLRLSRYGSRTGETPTSGFKQQEVLGVELRSKSSGATAAGTRSVEFSSTVGKNTINGKTLREGGVINGSSAVLTESLLADVLIEKDVTTAITELWRFRNGDLPVNTSDLDPEIVDFEGVDEDDVTDSEYFLVEIKDGEAQ